MESVVELERKLVIAKAREKRAKEVCAGCDGKGYFLDTTYDRTGEETACSRCHGTGLPAAKVRELISAAMAPFRIYPKSPESKASEEDHKD